MQFEPTALACAIPVPLGRSCHKTLIDPEDAALVVQYRWYRNPNGYAMTVCRREDGTSETLVLHRLLMGCKPGDGLEVDHINLNRLDNRRVNLRVVTRGENDQNRPNGYGKYSKHRGVTWNKDRWRAVIAKDGKQIALGRYDSELDAARAAEAGRRAHMPFALPVRELEPLPPCCCKACQPDAARARQRVSRAA